MSRSSAPGCRGLRDGRRLLAGRIGEQLGGESSDAAAAAIRLAGRSATPRRAWLQAGAPATWSQQGSRTTSTGVRARACSTSCPKWSACAGARWTSRRKPAHACAPGLRLGPDGVPARFQHTGDRSRSSRTLQSSTAAYTHVQKSWMTAGGGNAVTNMSVVSTTPTRSRSGRSPRRAESARPSVAPDRGARGRCGEPAPRRRSPSLVTRRDWAL